MLIIGFGWGKPVQFNPFGLKMSPKMASFFVALAGPMSNFVMAAIFAIPIQLDLVPYINPFTRSALLLNVEGRDQYIGLFLTGAVYLNCILGVFNLIPIPPLDGFKVALGILPDDLAAEFAKLDRYGFGILMIVLFLIPFATGWSPVWDIMAPTVRELVKFLTGVQ
jgi:Zn-dependent protease